MKRSYLLACVAISWSLVGPTEECFAQRVVFFRNDLTTDIDLTLSAPQNPAGTTRFIRGQSVAFRLISQGAFDLTATARDDGVSFSRQNVDLQTLLNGMGRNNVVSVRGVFDDDLGFDNWGAYVAEKRVAVLFLFQFQSDSRPFMVTATPDGPSNTTWRCRSVQSPAFPEIYGRCVEAPGLPFDAAPAAPAPAPD